MKLLTPEDMSPECAWQDHHKCDEAGWCTCLCHVEEEQDEQKP